MLVVVVVIVVAVVVMMMMMMVTVEEETVKGTRTQHREQRHLSSLYKKKGKSSKTKATNN